MLLVAQPIIGEDEKAALSAVIDSGWITMGEQVRAFERAFAAQHGATDAVAVSSCTAALHLIMQGLGIGPGDEVLVPSLTFVATVNCVLYAGATPVFVDIDSLELPFMSVADAAGKCTSKTKAVILMHYAGYLAYRQLWRDFARSRRLLLIEDAAHAAGAEHAGSYGEAAAFSLYGNKNLTTAEGGVVITADDQLRDTIRRMRTHGMTSGTFERLSRRGVDYDVTMLGYNYRMDDLRAAIGLVQLERLSSWNDKRRRLTQRYMRALREFCPQLILPFADFEHATRYLGSTHHILPVVLPGDVERQAVIDDLRAAGIQTSNHYPAVHRLSYFRRRFPAVELPLTDEFAQRELTLPLHPTMAEWQVEEVAATLASALRPTHVRQGALS